MSACAGTSSGVPGGAGGCFWADESCDQRPVHCQVWADLLSRILASHCQAGRELPALGNREKQRLSFIGL